MPAAPTAVTVASGATYLRVTFTAPALITATDTFAYKTYGMGSSPVQVGDAAGYVVPRCAGCCGGQEPSAPAGGPAVRGYHSCNPHTLHLAPLPLTATALLASPCPHPPTLQGPADGRPGCLWAKVL